MQGGTAFRSGDSIAGHALMDLLRVPFVTRGRDLSGWDCVGLNRYLTKAAFGVDLPDWGDTYEGTDWRDSQTLAASITAGMSRFTRIEGAPMFGDWLLFRRFGVDCHVGWALSAAQMIHADDAHAARGRFSVVGGGGTYVADIDRAPWKGRLSGVFRPKEASR